MTEIGQSVILSIPVVFGYFAPAKMIILILLIVISFDTYYGIKIGRKSDKGLTSSRFNDLFAKILSYGFFILIGLYLKEEFGWEHAPLYASLPAFLSEFKSIDENQRKLGGKGWFKLIEDLWHFILIAKQERDKLNRNE